jgi:hypothetical protein
MSILQVKIFLGFIILSKIRDHEGLDCTQGVESHLLPHPQPERPLQEGQEGEHPPQQQDGQRVGTLIKKKRKFSSCIWKFRLEQLQSHTVYEEGVPNI